MTSSGNSADERAQPGGGESRPRPQPEDPSLLRHEEEATVDKRWEGIGHARIRRIVEREKVRGKYPRRFDELVQERVPVGEDDSGKIETLPDGSISIPLFEEELEVVRRTVLRERVIIRKELATEWQTIETELRRERIAFENEAPERRRPALEPFAGERLRRWAGSWFRR